MKKMIPLGFLTAFLPATGLAHEGHGHTHGFTITHYFAEPEHLALLLVLLTAGMLYLRRYSKKGKKV